MIMKFTFLVCHEDDYLKAHIEFLQTQVYSRC